MFYIPDLLQKKGPWALVWLAGTYPKRIQSRHTQHSSVHALCEDIMASEVPLSLRLSSILMSGLAYIYYHQTEKLYNDTALRLKEISVTFLPEGKTRGKRTKARNEDITLKPLEEYTALSLWENIDELSLSNLDSADILSGYTVSNLPTQKKNQMRMSTSYQANMEDITLPEQIELQFEADEYDFGLLTELEVDETSISHDALISRAGIIPESPQPFELPSALNFDFNRESEIEFPSKVSPVHAVGISTNNQSELHEEDNQFLQTMQQNPQTHHFNLRLDRRISLDGDEIRATIDDTSDISKSRPESISSVPVASTNTFFMPIISVDDQNEELAEVWKFMTEELGTKEQYNLQAHELESLHDESTEIAPFLPDISDEPGSFGRAVEELRFGATEESIELRKASIATPYNYQEASEAAYYQSTPTGGQSPLFSSIGRPSSPLPQRRASSIRPLGPQSPLYSEPQYFEAQSLNVLPVPPLEPAPELITSINENSVKMLKYVKSKLKNNISVQFSEVTENMNRNQAAKSFFEILVLSSTGYLDCLQTNAYDQIIIRQGDVLLSQQVQ